MAELEKEIAALVRMTELNRLELEDLMKRVEQLQAAIVATRQNNNHTKPDPVAPKQKSSRDKTSPQ